MVKFVTYILLIWIFPSSLYINSVPCLTWKISREKLTFTCRIAGFYNSVSLVDSHGQLYGECTFSRNLHHCNPTDRKDLIDVQYSRKSIVFTIVNFDDSVNGIWACLQDNLRLTTQVSLSKGIIDSTEVFITGTVSNTTKHAINCFSCREPDGDNVDFLMNGRTEDSITYNKATGKCTHHKGECHPDKCSCNANMFTRSFQWNLKTKSLSYTCDMLFTDFVTDSVFSKQISIDYTGKEFYNMSTTTKVIKPGYTNWSRTITTKEIVTEFEPTQTTSTEILDTKETEDNITVENNDNQMSYVIVISVLCLMVFILVTLLHCRSMKRQPMIVMEIGEHEHIVPSMRNRLFGEELNQRVGESFRKMIAKSKHLPDSVESLHGNQVVSLTASATAYRELRNMSLSLKTKKLVKNK